MRASRRAAVSDHPPGVRAVAETGVLRDRRRDSFRSTRTQLGRAVRLLRRACDALDLVSANTLMLEHIASVGLPRRATRRSATAAASTRRGFARRTPFATAGRGVRPRCSPGAALALDAVYRRSASARGRLPGRRTADRLGPAAGPLANAPLETRGARDRRARDRHTGHAGRSPGTPDRRPLLPGTLVRPERPDTPRRVGGCRRGVARARADAGACAADGPRRGRRGRARQAAGVPRPSSEATAASSNNGRALTLAAR